VLGCQLGYGGGGIQCSGMNTGGAGMKTGRWDEYRGRWDEYRALG
jgi:hypothetical protein